MKYRIVNKTRFVIFCTIVIIFLSFIFIAVFNIAEGKNNIEKDCILGTISEGDTLWEIANEFGNSKKDVRVVIYEICKLNNISADSIKPGQEILVPVN